jgi:Ca2+-binding EF-hand superfamily protein
MRLPLQIGVAALVLAGATTANAQMRFQSMDANRDGVVTRSEWRGTDAMFRNNDWNGDGMLSGDEVRTGGRRQNWTQDWNRDGRVDNLDSQISQRFRGYDMNADNRVGRSEWPGDGRLFARLDANRDGYLSIQEYTQGGGFALDSQGGPSYRFANIDMNNDGWVTRNEWNMGVSDFNRLDLNRDNRISRFEFENDTAAYNDHLYSPAQFNTFDRNRDGWVTRAESRFTSGEFDRIDTNRDNRISRYEFENVAIGADASPNDTTRSAAWRTGYDRGIQEGRAAGREDYTRRHGWDLEGQRELELADSGYSPQVGSLSDYQAGYREGFRNAYRAGFIDAGGRAPQ